MYGYDDYIWNMLFEIGIFDLFFFGNLGIIVDLVVEDVFFCVRMIINGVIF